MTKEELLNRNKELSIELVTSKEERREEILREKFEIFRKLEERDYEEV
jgi:hypothetical protein